MKKYIGAVCAILIATPGMVRAQQVLSLEEAIKMGLSNNHDVLLVRNVSLQSANLASYGNSGMLPQLNLTSSGSKSNNHISQKFSNGLELDTNGIRAGNLNNSLGLSWTLFDGFKMFASYKKLEEIAIEGELKVRQQMEATVFEIISAYYNIARQEQKRRAIEKLMEIYRERVNVAQTRMDLGNGNLTDVLQAKLELNEQISAEAQQKTLIANAKSALNILIGGDNYDFTTDSSGAPGMQPLSAFQSQLSGGNTAMKIANSQISQANYGYREFISYRYPKLAVGANYNLVRSSSEAGFSLLNQSSGLSYGFNLSWTLFNGFQNNTLISNARITKLSTEILLNRERKIAEESLLQAYNRFSEAHKLIEIESESVALAQQFVSLMLERFKLAQSTSLELKDAQNSYLQAQLRQADAEYNAKVADAEIKRLLGTLF